MERTHCICIQFDIQCLHMHTSLCNNKIVKHTHTHTNSLLSVISSAVKVFVYVFFFSLQISCFLIAVFSLLVEWCALENREKWFFASFWCTSTWLCIYTYGNGSHCALMIKFHMFNMQQRVVKKWISCNTLSLLYFFPSSIQVYCTSSHKNLYFRVIDKEREKEWASERKVEKIIWRNCIQIDSFSHSSIFYAFSIYDYFFFLLVYTCMLRKLHKNGVQKPNRLLFLCCTQT